MDENSKKCPICPRGCDLSNPHCNRGVEYAQTGIVSQKHGHSTRLHFENKDQQLIMKYLHHAINVVDYGGITQQQANDMFTILTEEDTLYLANLLKTLTEHWMTMAPHKPTHHDIEK